MEAPWSEAKTVNYALMNTRTPRSARPRQRGSAVIVVIALLSIVLIYIAGNVRTLHFLTHEIRLVEQRQVRRLATIKIQRKPVAPSGAEAVPINK